MPARHLRPASTANAKIHVSAVRMPSAKYPITEPLVGVHLVTWVNRSEGVPYQSIPVTMTPVAKAHYVNWTTAIQSVCVHEAPLATLLRSAVSGLVYIYIVDFFIIIMIIIIIIIFMLFYYYLSPKSP